MDYIYSMDFIRTTMPFIEGEISLVYYQEEQKYIGLDGNILTEPSKKMLYVIGKGANGSEEKLTMFCVYNTKIFRNQKFERVNFDDLYIGMKIKAFYDDKDHQVYLIEEINK